MTKSIPTLLLTLLFAGSVFAEEGHDHAPIKGPHGGKVLEVADVHIEFFVTPERIVEVRFFDEKMRPLSVTRPLICSRHRSGRSEERQCRF